MANSLKNWWETGDLGTVQTEISMSDRTLVKIAVTVIMIYVIIALSGRLIKGKK